jgi:hypothetical protein
MTLFITSTLSSASTNASTRPTKRPALPDCCAETRREERWGEGEEADQVRRREALHSLDLGKGGSRRDIAGPARRSS